MVRRDDWFELSREEVQARRAAYFERRARASRREPPAPEATLGKIRAAHEWFWLYCETIGCGHNVAMPVAPLIIRWGPEAPRSHLLRGFRCTRCGGRQTSIRFPSWGGREVGWKTIDEGRQWTGTAVWPEPLSMHYMEDRAYGAGRFHFSPVLGSLDFDAMCNLYSQTRSRDEIRGLFRVSDNRAYAFEPLPAIFPRAVAPVVRVAADGERELVPMTWGFPLLRKGYAPKPVTNIRDDTVLTSPFWRPSFDARRCLVPASSYCEPDSNTPAGWHWFAIKGDHERPLFAFPGVWKRYHGPMRKDGPNVEADVFAFMTTKPNKLTATIMHDRMPVLLSEPEDFETWLSGSVEEAYRLVRTYDAGRMRIVQSGGKGPDLLGLASLTEKLL